MQMNHSPNEEQKISISYPPSVVCKHKIPFKDQHGHFSITELHCKNHNITWKFKLNSFTDFT